ncbi:DUF397 domain-containing protein [Streptomyces sp. ODS28]|uniref:DUF397 domain-containing protein n=1 Tax=Streptomyces sp. ODS28 TaxID=3136688 RepID=UPI0031E9D942
MSERLEWFKSSHSDSEGGNCVEVAGCAGAPTVHIRDSKRPDTVPHLCVPTPAWRAFVAYASARTA